MAITSRDALLLKLGAARNQAPSAWRLVEIEVQPKTKDNPKPSFTFTLLKDKLKQVRRREGRYLLRTNLIDSDPARFWQFYIQLTQVEQAFKDLKGDMALRPLFHQLEHRIEAHILVAFIAYCLHVTLHQKLKVLASGLSPRAVIEKFKSMQMLDVILPTTDKRHIVLSRYTEPDKDLAIILEQLQLQLPAQPPPKIYAQPGN